MLQSIRSSARYIWLLIFILFVGGFLLLDTSGILGMGSVTPSTVVASVNGDDILYSTYLARAEQLRQQASEQSGRALNLDEMQRLDDQAFEELVAETLLRQEYEARGITADDDEIFQAVQYLPHPAFMQNPDYQTEGRFDMVKYQRFIQSSVARQQGILPYLEAYYRTEIPRQKLFEQIATDVYLTDGRMWQLWQDVNDSAQVSFVAFSPDVVPDSSVTVTDAEVREYYDAHRDDASRPGRAFVSILKVPRVITASDSAAARARAARLRAEIVAGAKFEDVAARESADSGTLAVGGSLGMSARDRFDADFSRAAWALRVGELSQPVLTSYGYHLIKVDARKGDSANVRHILVPVQQSDSNAAATDQRADSLSDLAAGQTDPAQFDSAAKKLGITPIRTFVFEHQPLMAMGEYVPSVSAWAFSGALVGDVSELFDSENAYYVARLDTLHASGSLTLAEATPGIRERLMREKKLAKLLPDARTFANSAAASTLEQAARTRGLQVTKSEIFNRLSFVPGMGQGNQAIGAAFSLPVGAVSAPVETPDAVYVIRVDRRVNADRAKWEAQKQVQRQLLGQSMRQQRVQQFLQDLRSSADVKDNRTKIESAARRAAV